MGLKKREVYKNRPWCERGKTKHILIDAGKKKWKITEGGKQNVMFQCVK